MKTLKEAEFDLAVAQEWLDALYSMKDSYESMREYGGGREKVWKRVMAKIKVLCTMADHEVLEAEDAQRRYAGADALGVLARRRPIKIKKNRS
jgi:hypothetical protein